MKRASKIIQYITSWNSPQFNPSELKSIILSPVCSSTISHRRLISPNQHEVLQKYPQFLLPNKLTNHPHVLHHEQKQSQLKSHSTNISLIWNTHPIPWHCQLSSRKIKKYIFLLLTISFKRRPWHKRAYS